MTVATTQISEVWTGDASSVTFPIPFPFLDRAHLIVWKEDSLGVETSMTIVSATGEGESSGGSITLTEPVGVGYTLHVRRNTPKTQETDYVPHDPFPADSHERALDKLTMIVQELIASGSIVLDIDHLGDLIGDSSTIIWTVSPDGTKLIGSVVPGFGDTYKVKLDEDDAAPGYLDEKMADATDVQFTPKSGALDSIVYQLTGLGAQLVEVPTSFTWGGWGYGSSMGGRGISPGYAWIGGVHTKVWCANDGVANLYWTADEWVTVVRDASLYGIVGPGSMNWHPPCLRYLAINGVPSWVATSDNLGDWYYAQDIASNFNANGTLKASAWVLGPAAPHVIADIGVSSSASCMVGNHGFITRTINWTSFTDVYSGANVIGGIDTDRFGKWVAFERDTGVLLMSTDDGVTWTAPQAYVRSNEGDPYIAASSVMPTGSVCAGNGVWLITGASGYAYSYDGIHWTIQNNPLGSFYGVGFDGVKFYAVNPNNAGSPPPVIYQLLVSEIPVHRQLVAEKGATVDGGLWVRDVPNASMLSTDELGRAIKKVITISTSVPVGNPTEEDAVWYVVPA